MIFIFICKKREIYKIKEKRGCYRNVEKRIKMRIEIDVDY